MGAVGGDAITKKKGSYRRFTVCMYVYVLTYLSPIVSFILGTWCLCSMGN
jgi:cytochrome oxidase assembly protein ShyY1